MAKLFEGDALWAELRRVARKSKRLDAAVAFIGHSPRSVLRWPKATRLVGDVSGASVAAGRTSARGVKELMKAGAEVRSFAGLHAKVYVFDKVAFVGSPNASEHSMQLREAAVKLTNRNEVENARAFVSRLWRDASPLPDQLLRQLIAMEPKRVGGTGGQPPARKKSAGRRSGLEDLIAGRAVWLDAVTKGTLVPALTRARETVARQLANDDEVERASEVEWTGLRASDFRTVPEQDYLFVWWEPNPGTKRAPLGRLEGPFRCLGGFDLGKRLGDDRYSRAEHPIRRRSVALDGSGLAALSKLIPRAKVARSRAHAEHLHDRLSRGKVLAIQGGDRRAFLKLIARLSG
ncbi:MAG: phospholipase D family protein [Myxococcales bacterium]|nr:phospholipase D family protein [Myxococcales bacterium]